MFGWSMLKLLFMFNSYSTAIQRFRFFTSKNRFPRRFIAVQQYPLSSSPSSHSHSFANDFTLVPSDQYRLSPIVLGRRLDLFAFPILVLPAHYPYLTDTPVGGGVPPDPLVLHKHPCSPTLLKSQPHGASSPTTSRRCRTSH